MKLSFILQILLFQISNQIVIQSCCKYQSNFHIKDQKCLDSQHTSYRTSSYPVDFYLTFPIAENVTESIHFHLKKRISSFSCLQKATRLVIQTDLENLTHGQFQMFHKDGYLQFGNVILPPTKFCVNSVLPETNTLEIFACDQTCMNVNKNANRCLPKCCAWGKVSRWLHPELCYQPSNFSSSNLVPKRRTYKSLFSFYIQTLKCRTIGRMITTTSIDMFNQTELNWIKQSLPVGEYCIDDVITSHDMTFDWQRHQAVFYCGEKFPVDLFGLTELEKIIYGVCMILSTFFLIISIGVYYVKLHLTHSYVHTWIEFFYMISLLLLGIFIAIQIYLPERQDNYCTLYHFVAVFGYTLFGVALFSWASLLNLDLFIAFRELRPLGIYTNKDKKRLFVYCLIGFSFPIVVAVASFVYSYIYYWEIAGFCMPIQYKAIRTTQGILLLFNTTFFICTFALIIQHRRSSRFATGKNPKEVNQLISCFIKLFIVSGITYGGVIFSYVYGMERESAWYLICFRVFLNLRGVTIFFIYVCNPQMKKILCQRYSDGIFCECICCKGTQPKKVRNMQSLRSTFKRTLSLTM